MKSDELADILCASMAGACQKADICRVLTDSRSLFMAQGTIFFALRTEHGDGFRYVEELYGRGVRHFCVSGVDDSLCATLPEATFYIVENTLDALQAFAAAYRNKFDIPVVGITGSNGKTVVKEWLSQVLSLDGRQVTRSPRSYNSQVGVPLSLLELSADSQIGVFEAGISMPGEMGRLERMIRPTLGILTNIGEAHSRNFESEIEKTTEKLKLFSHCDTLVCCIDSPSVARCVGKNIPSCVKLCTWSRFDRNATLHIVSEAKTNDITILRYIYNGEEAELQIPFVDAASVENSINVLLASLSLGVNADIVQRSLMQTEGLAMRLEVKEGRSGCTVINDAYSLDIRSLSIALDFMKRRSEATSKKCTVILSDILQSEQTPDELYGTVATLLSVSHIDHLIGVGRELTAHQKAFCLPRTSFYPSTEALVASGEVSTMANELVLVKGAREFHFEQIASMLEGRQHETILEVNLESVVANLNYYRNQMQQSGAKICCMVKADAYGAGAIEVSRTLQEHHADYLAVAVADEGVALRRAGIRLPIIVMNPEMAALHTLFEYSLEPEVYSFRVLNAMIEAARRDGVKQHPVHLKLDTGMHRLGFHPVDDVDRLVSVLKGQSQLMPHSVFSHFVGSDDDVFDSFSQHQYDLFSHGADIIAESFPNIMRHIDNTAGIEHFPGRQMQMCRLGLGLYGVNPRGNQTLNVVSSLTTTILQIRDIPAGDSVGYSRRTVVDRPSRIAAIPIGYADGLNRRLGNRKGYCLVNGKPAPYLGNICMDVCMVDITDIPDVKEGDSVEIFGPSLPVQQLAEWLETIPYEVLTGVSGRIPRVYFQ